MEKTFKIKISLRCGIREYCHDSEAWERRARAALEKKFAREVIVAQGREDGDGVLSATAKSH